MRTQCFDRGRTVRCADDLISVIGPFELALQAFVIFHDE
jgi:hypothetical protein